MKKVKTIAFALAAVLALGALVGCAGNEDAGNAEVTTISIWHPNTHTQKYYEEKVAEYNETIGKKKGIRIEYECKTDLNKQMELALANDTAPDIIMELTNYQRAAELGQIIALDDIPGGQEIIDKYKDYATPSVFDGKIYRVPYNVNTRALIYNKDMFKAAGLVDENGEPTPPTTYAEVIEYAKKLTNPEKNEYGIVLPAKWNAWVNEWLGAMMNSTGTNGFNPETVTFDYSGLRPLAEMYNQIRKDGSCLPGADSLDNDPARARFAEGIIGMKFSMSYDVAVLTDQFPAKCDWGVAPLPFANENEKYMQDVQVNQFGCINAKSVKEKGAEKVLEVYNWFISDEVMQDMYKKGYFIPVLYDVIKDVKPEEIEAPSQWIDYGNMLEISVFPANAIPRDYGEDLNVKTTVIDYLWTQQWTIDQTIDYMNEKAADAIKRYKETHPNVDEKNFIVENWDVRRKD